MAKQKKTKRRDLEARLDAAEARSDEALRAARAAERTALEIGDAAFDAADQARRAADMALVLASGPRGEAPSSLADGEDGAGNLMDPQLRHFTERADRVVARLRALDRLPVASTVS